jgi:hypothetical protein
MKISDVIGILQKQKMLERTPKGRPITEKAIEVLNATLSDEKNYHVEAVRCKNCGIISSSLLVPEGCVNCGSKDLTAEI